MAPEERPLPADLGGANVWLFGAWRVPHRESPSLPGTFWEKEGPPGLLFALIIIIIMKSESKNAHGLKTMLKTE